MSISSPIFIMLSQQSQFCAISLTMASVLPDSPLLKYPESRQFYAYCHSLLNTHLINHTHTLSSPRQIVLLFKHLTSISIFSITLFHHNIHTYSSSLHSLIYMSHTTSLGLPTMEQYIPILCCSAIYPATPPAPQKLHNDPNCVYHDVIHKSFTEFCDRREYEMVKYGKETGTPLPALPTRMEPGAHLLPRP
ncbi:hypothetical protein BJ878DRAFT_107745 [Calycina marina]|uniref:Uncharacterized protein n=1 Tax=Calycina marina TaxID=1763456 RepID=A0A9P7Z1M6_9HELO|nr:hypothetical protein BJ878DRAFT_107745 [Calycina marina]